MINNAQKAISIPITLFAFALSPNKKFAISADIISAEPWEREKSTAEGIVFAANTIKYEFAKRQTAIIRTIKEISLTRTTSFIKSVFSFLLQIIYETKSTADEKM